MTLPPTIQATASQVGYVCRDLAARACSPTATCGAVTWPVEAKQSRDGILPVFKASIPRCNEVFLSNPIVHRPHRCASAKAWASVAVAAALLNVVFAVEIFASLTATSRFGVTSPEKARREVGKTILRADGNRNVPCSALGETYTLSHNPAGYLNCAGDTLTALSAEVSKPKAPLAKLSRQRVAVCPHGGQTRGLPGAFHSSSSIIYRTPLWPFGVRRDAAGRPLHAISHHADGTLRVGTATAYGNE
jgi:hypothetical protein